MEFRPLHDGVVIRPLPPVLQKGSIHLPEKQEWLDREKGQAIEGIVLLVGLGDKIAPRDSGDCRQCQTSLSSEYVMATNSYRCADCGDVEPAVARRYRLDARRDITRGPMFLKKGMKVLYWPTQLRLKKVEIDGVVVDVHICHEEQHILGFFGEQSDDSELT